MAADEGHLHRGISIHALREEGDRAAIKVGLKHKDISIHALREEGDAQRTFHWLTEETISIHALREEGDKKGKDVADYIVEFQSTPSARRATSSSSVYSISPIISIHALREEGDIAPRS